MRNDGVRGSLRNKASSDVVVGPQEMMV